MRRVTLTDSGSSMIDYMVFLFERPKTGTFKTSPTAPEENPKRSGEMAKA